MQRNELNKQKLQSEKNKWLFDFISVLTTKVRSFALQTAIFIKAKDEENEVKLKEEESFIKTLLSNESWKKYQEQIKKFFSKLSADEILNKLARLKYLTQIIEDYIKYLNELYNILSMALIFYTTKLYFIADKIHDKLISQYVAPHQYDAFEVMFNKFKTGNIDFDQLKNFIIQSSNKNDSEKIESEIASDEDLQNDVEQFGKTKELIVDIEKQQTECLNKKQICIDRKSENEELLAPSNISSNLAVDVDRYVLTGENLIADKNVVIASSAIIDDAESKLDDLLAAFGESAEEPESDATKKMKDSQLLSTKPLLNSEKEDSPAGEPPLDVYKEQRTEEVKAYSKIETKAEVSVSEHDDQEWADPNEPGGEKQIKVKGTASQPGNKLKGMAEIEELSNASLEEKLNLEDAKKLQQEAESKEGENTERKKFSDAQRPQPIVLSLKYLSHRDQSTKKNGNEALDPEAKGNHHVIHLNEKFNESEKQKIDQDKPKISDSVDKESHSKSIQGNPSDDGNKPRRPGM